MVRNVALSQPFYQTFMLLCFVFSKRCFIKFIHEVKKLNHFEAVGAGVSRVKGFQLKAQYIDLGKTF